MFKDVLDVHPVTGAIEHRLEYNQRRSIEDRNLASFQRNRNLSRRDLLMQREIVEEKVDRSFAPAQTDLARVPDSPNILWTVADLARKRCEHAIRFIDTDEYIQIDIACPTRILCAKSESYRTPDRMGDPSRIKGVENGEQPFDQPAQRWIGLAGRSCWAAGWKGSASANSITSTIALEIHSCCSVKVPSGTPE